MTDLMPVIFFGHGNPMNTLLNNDYTIMAFRPIISSPCLNNLFIRYQIEIDPLNIVSVNRTSPADLAADAGFGACEFGMLARIHQGFIDFMRVALIMTRLLDVFGFHLSPHSAING
jgi:hypothetical protein